MLTFAYRIVLGLAFYLPLEDFLLKWLPVSDFTYLALRQAPDLLTLVAAGVVVAAKLTAGDRVRVVGRRVELALLGLVGVAFFSVGLNGSSLMPAVLNLKALLRYVLILYVLINVPIDEARVRRLVGVVLAAVAIQMAVAAVQFVGGPEVASFFLPQSTEASFAGLQLHFTATWEVGRGRVFGTMGQTVGFAGFMIVGLAVWITTESRRLVRYWAGVLVFGLFLYLSGSRAALFTGFLLVLVHQYLAGYASATFLVGALAACAVGVSVLLADVGLAGTEIFSVFTERYLEIAAEQRLGVIISVLPEFVTSVDLQRMLFGFSADPAVIEAFIAGMFNAPRTLVRQVGIVEDVYWGAIVLYYGLAGFASMAYVVGSLGYEAYGIRKQNESRRLPRELATVGLLLLTAAVPLNLVGRAFEVRQFAFYLWAGVGLALAYRQQIHPASGSQRQA